MMRLSSTQGHPEILSGYPRYNIYTLMHGKASSKWFVFPTLRSFVVLKEKRKDSSRMTREKILPIIPMSNTTNI
jgi:hypothetical protein